MSFLMENTKILYPYIDIYIYIHVTKIASKWLTESFWWHMPMIKSDVYSSTGFEIDDVIYHKKFVIYQINNL